MLCLFLLSPVVNEFLENSSSGLSTENFVQSFARDHLPAIQAPTQAYLPRHKSKSQKLLS